MNKYRISHQVRLHRTKGSLKALCLEGEAGRVFHMDMGRECGMRTKTRQGMHKTGDWFPVLCRMEVQ